MTGAIPPYGKNFSREQMPYDADRDLATRRYVLRTDRAWSVRSTRDSEHWTVYVAGPAGAQFPLGQPFDTLTEAMTACVTAWKAVHARD